MAQRVNVVIADDFDGTEGAQTVKFGLDGTEYEIDLKPDHEEQLRAFLSAYVQQGRKVASGKKTTVKPRKSASAGEANAIREWARANGYAVNERGRVPANIVEAYHAAKGASAPAQEPAQIESTGVAEPAFVGA